MPENDTDTPVRSFSILPQLFLLILSAIYILPFLLFQGRLDYEFCGFLDDPTHHLDGMLPCKYTLNDSLSALATVAWWFIAALLPILCFRKPIFRSLPIAKSPIHFQFLTFTLLIVVGASIFLVHAFVIFPAAVENLVHQLSLMLSVGFFYGFIVSANQELSSRQARAIIALTALAGLLLLLIPLAHGKATGAGVVFVLAIGALRVGNFRGRQLLYVAVPLAMVLLTSLTMRGVIRDVFYDGWPYERTNVLTGKRAFSSGSQTAQLLTADTGTQLSARITKIQACDNVLLEHLLGHTLGCSASHVLTRLDQLKYLVMVMKRTPAEIPYASDHSYWGVFASLVPRALWPDKPEATWANTYARRYGLTRPDDFRYSQNINLIIELWMTGGYPHVIAGGLLTGFCWVLLYGWLNRGGSEMLRLLLCAPTLVSALAFESEGSLFLGGLIQSYVFYGILFFLWHRLFARLTATPAVHCKQTP